MGPKFLVATSDCIAVLPGGALRAASLATTLLLAGCPQLHDVDFDVLARGAPSAAPDAGGAGSDRPPSGRPVDGGTMPTGGSDVHVALAAALAHRYGFGGAGEVAIDSVAGVDGRVVETALTGTGSVELAGNGQYVDFPNGLLSSTNEQTIEAWLIWNGGNIWQRVFDFGSSDSGENERGAGNTYLFMTPRGVDDRIVVGYSTAGYGAETRLDATGALQIGVLTHVAVVIDSPNDALSLYIDGSWDASTTLDGRLSDLDDVNSWVGMSQFEGDPTLDANLTEFRLYHRALTRDEVRSSYESGPDATL